MSELILFSCRADKYFQIYSVRPDGRDLKPVIRINYDCREPDLCFESGEIVFSMFAENRWNLYKTDLKGSFVQKLTDSVYTERHPVWSPDGSFIVFQTSQWGAEELACIDKYGRNLTRLTHGGVNCSSPKWSEDGKKIAYVSCKNGKPDIYVMDWENKSSRAVTRKFIACVAPSWFPDNRRIVFQGRSYYGRFIAFSDEKRSLTKVNADTRHASFPAVSPDGTKILYSENFKNVSRLVLFDIQSQTSEVFPAEIPAGAYDVSWQKKRRTWE